MMNDKRKATGFGATRVFAITSAAIVLTSLGACGQKESTPVTPSAAPETATSGSESGQSATQPAPSAPPPSKDAKQVFWESLETLCGKRFSGQLTIGTEESDRDIGLADLTMYSKRCSRNAIDIGFKVDDDDSRTWKFRRTDEGLSLHHRHVDKSGKEDDTSGYGGYSATPGTAIRQEFPADENTGTMIPAAATNVWAVEVTPGDKFAYELQRIEEQRMFRVVFDLTQPAP